MKSIWIARLELHVLFIDHINGYIYLYFLTISPAAAAFNKTIHNHYTSVTLTPNELMWCANDHAIYKFRYRSLLYPIIFVFLLPKHIRTLFIFSAGAEENNDKRRNAEDVPSEISIPLFICTFSILFQYEIVISIPCSIYSKPSAIKLDFYVKFFYKIV